MAAQTTEAVVLHAFDYLESSRIIKLLTRDLGLRSVLARGARRSAKRFGAALDLFVQGTAELELKSGRDLDTLTSFDLAHTRASIGQDLSRFTAASALAELILRFAKDGADEELYDVTVEALDRVSVASGGAARDAAIAGAWRILAALGFGPSLDECSDCARELDPAESVLFSHSSGGVVCDGCARGSRVGRKLPPEARVALQTWMLDIRPERSEEKPAVGLTDAEARAHQRLLREFVHEHLSDGKPLKAFDAWETGAWSADVAPSRGFPSGARE
jgi:DNA repair protein RecO (recombination protein O)